MNAIKLLFLLTIFLATVFSCNDTASKQEETTTSTDTTAAPAADATAGKTMTLTAKFVDFTLGDASHYAFEDETGKAWDFAGNDDTHFAFSVELPKEEADETNQGWGSDKALQGKWFVLKYTYRTQPEYQDGPMASVPVILEAKLKE